VTRGTCKERPCSSKKKEWGKERKGGACYLELVKNSG